MQVNEEVIRQNWRTRDPEGEGNRLVINNRPQTRNRHRIECKWSTPYNTVEQPSGMTLEDIVPVPKQLKDILEKSLQEIMLLNEENNKYVKLVQSLIKETTVSPNMHLEMLETLLFIEQYNYDEEIKKHDMKNQYITQCNKPKIFKINVPTMEEDDPFLIPSDVVWLRESLNPENEWHSLKIVKVGNDFVTAKTKKYPAWFDNETYDVQFQVKNYPMQCFQFTLRRISELSEGHKTSLFYPVPAAACNKVKEITESSWFNKTIAGNMEQKQAVQHIISQTAKPAPYILFGPPGTGKTATLVEAVLQIWNSDPSNRVLICTPSNSAADEVYRRILKYGVPPFDVMRLKSASRKLLIDYEIPSSSDSDDDKVKRPRFSWLDKIRRKRIIICTLTRSMRLVKLGLERTHFSFIFIDEAGQAHEAETFIPYGLTNYQMRSTNCQIVMAGDPKQLGPVVQTRIAERLLGTSMLERLMSLDLYKRDRNNKYNVNYITKLIKNFRSHEAILEVPNRLFYNCELVACGGAHIKLAEDWEYLPRKKFPIIFHAVDGCEYGESGSPSACNEDEIDIVIEYIRKLASSKIFKDENIGVITPFKLQVRKIQGKLQKMGKTGIEVSTVQGFQGQEKDVIIMTTVRSRVLEHDGKAHIGFLSNEKRFNVSITRAKALLIVIGNPNVLKYDIYWREFIMLCKFYEACTGITVDTEELTSDEIKSLLERKKIMVETKCQKNEKTGTIDPSVNASLSIQMSKLTVLEQEDPEVFDQHLLSTEDSKTGTLDFSI